MMRRVSHFSDLLQKFLGRATAEAINNVAITEPATGATLTLADGSTLAISGAFSVTITATAATTVTLPTSGTLATRDGDLGTPSVLVGTNITDIPASALVAGSGVTDTKTPPVSITVVNGLVTALS